MIHSRQPAKLFFLITGALHFFYTAAAAQTHCGERDPLWKQCQTEADCVLDKGACGLTEAYAKSALPQVHTYNTCMQLTFPCAGSPKEPEGEMRAVCMGRKCLLRIRGPSQETRPRIFGSGEGARRKVTEMKLEKLASSLRQYKLMWNRNAQSLKELTECAPPGKGCVQLAEADDFLDSWGNSIQYACSPAGDCTLLSFGTDGTAGGDGDNADISKVLNK